MKEIYKIDQLIPKEFKINLIKSIKEFKTMKLRLENGTKNIADYKHKIIEIKFYLIKLNSIRDYQIIQLKKCKN